MCDRQPPPKLVANTPQKKYFLICGKNLRKKGQVDTEDFKITLFDGKLFLAKTKKFGNEDFFCFRKNPEYLNSIG